MPISPQTCNVCKTPFTCPPPSRLDLMSSFTGAEIAALIQKESIIVSHERFSEELERQLHGVPAGIQELMGHRHWVRAVMLITNVESDTDFFTVPCRSTEALAAVKRRLFGALSSSSGGGAGAGGGTGAPGSFGPFVGWGDSSEDDEDGGLVVATKDEDADGGEQAEMKKDDEERVLSSEPQPISVWPPPANVPVPTLAAASSTLPPAATVKTKKASLLKASSADDDTNVPEEDPPTLSLQGRQFHLTTGGVFSHLKNERKLAYHMRKLNRTPCELNFRAVEAADCGNDHITAVSLTKKLSRCPKPGHVETAKKLTKYRGAKKDVELMHFCGGPCDEDELQCCIVLGGGGRGWGRVGGYVVQIG